jgi:hypothetical protein
VNTYRVTIVRESGNGDDYETETMLEVAGGALRVARTVQRELADIFEDEGVVGNLASGGIVAERVMDAARDAGAPVDPFRQSEVKPRRPRRTKAQIEADEKAARENAEKSAQPATDPLHTADDQAAPVPAAPVEQAFPGAVATPQPMPMAPAAVTGGTPGGEQPYNPFAVS